MIQAKTRTEAFLESFGQQPMATITAVLKILKNTYQEFLAPSDMPLSFERKGKKYKGYYAFGLKHIIRFETNRDATAPVSVSVWETGDSLGRAPKYSIFISPGGDIAPADVIAQAIVKGIQSKTQEALSNMASKVLYEATADDIKQFVDESGDDGGTLSSMYRKYSKWADAQGMRVVSDITFAEYLKKLRAGSTFNATSTSVSAMPGIPDDPTEQPQEYDDFEQEIINNNVLYKYEMMNDIVKKIVTWDPLYKNAFIYGVGGVGKSFTVNKVINEFADKSKIATYKGVISGFTGLLQILWQDRAGKVIILDDNDGILENANALNLLKGAMDSDEPRIISYTRLQKQGKAKDPTKEQESRLEIDLSKLHENIIGVYANGELVQEEFVTDDERRWHEKMSKHLSVIRENSFDTDIQDEMSEDPDFAALDPSIDPAFGMDAGEAVPDQFQFTSRVIFISNLMVVPQPLLDRCISVGLLLTKNQILDLIEKNIQFIMSKESPQITLEIKMEVLAFMRKYVSRIGKPLTFRLFQQLCSLFYSGHPDAKKMAYMVMQGEGMKSKMR